ncbi:MAG: CPBP family intramembrane metalloprotease [Thermoleophilia bacterium]|nr:CPBP family intramembrane metalloprotease [Thermoleophilia bacterium]
MRVRPRPAVGIAVAVAYAVVFIVVQLALGADYDRIADTTENVVRGIIAPVAAGAVLLIIVTTWLGWWRPALSERPSGPRWLWIVPALVLISAVVTLATGDPGSLSTELLVALAISTLLVGFGEELATRGVALVGLRGRYGEVGVWFGTSLIFGLLHGLNLVTGQAIGPTLRQVGFAFLFGTVFYVMRRLSGTLILCMALHALWDFSTFAHGGGEAGAATTDSPEAAGGLIGLLAVVIAFIGLRAMLRSPATPSGQEPAPARA